jgi:hypothetical protein
MIRQGDVLIRRGDLAAGRIVPAEDGRLILARGEATGHHHSVDARHGSLSIDEGGVMYLTIDQLTQVEHQEHAPLTLEPGVYEVTRQREYTPERPQYVGD